MPSTKHISELGEKGSTSRSLLVRLRDDDPAAWERLVTLYSPLVYYWCGKMNLPEQDMADVFQEVFQSVATHINDFRKDRPGDTFRGWLRTITRSKVYDHYRRQTRQPNAAGGTEAQIRFSQMPADDSSDETPSDSTNESSEEEIYNDLFLRALNLIRDNFAERTWQAFWRVVVDGRTPNEVAEELEMRPGTVRVAKSRVLHRLRKELGELLD
jgi:RNA polymerase sigma-70 factor (ECF subfamily)